MNTQRYPPVTDACVFPMGLPPLINIGMGDDLTIRELAAMVKEVVGYHGNIAFGADKSDGMPRKLLDVPRLATLGWRTETEMFFGLQQAYGDFQNSILEIQ
jgi:GDP-L-fucose synthase